MSELLKRFSGWQALLVALLALISVRLVMMAMLPLADTTESRYGEIARLTVEQGHWLMPHVAPEQPFLGKPPASTWLAASFAWALGITEFALRLPSFLLMLMVAAMVWRFARHLSHPARTFGSLVAFSSPVYFVSAGTVMTDSVHLACVTLALFSAWRVLDTGSRRATYLFWLACGVGMLAKGLATAALIAIPLGLYAITGGGIRRVLVGLIKIGPIVVSLLVAVPWYAWAEKTYPGFLEYFFIGEHFKRFTEPGWSGDQFGDAHQQPRGWIWVLWLLAIAPWIGFFVARLARAGKGWRALGQQERFLWCACLAPLVFFTFAGNILWTYCLTAVPPFAVLAAGWFEQAKPRRQRHLAFAVLAGTLVLAPTLAFLARNEAEQESDRGIVQAHQAAASATGKPLILTFPPNHSTHFYSRRQLMVASSADAQQQALRQPGAHVAVSARQIKRGILQGIDYQVLYANRRSTLIEIR